MKAAFARLAIGVFLGAGLVFQGACAPAAQETPPPQPDRFAVMDVDKDGKVVLEEFQAAFPNMNENAFLVIDRNKDKAIDRVEWDEFITTHASGKPMGAPMNNIPGDPLIPPPDSSDLPLVQPPIN